MHGRRSQLLGLAWALLLVFALTAATYGVLLVLVGQELTLFPEALPGEGVGDGQREPSPAFQGLIPLLGGALVAIGAATRRLWMAWAGAAVVTLFTALFAFGVGGALLPVAGAILVLLALISAIRTPSPI